MWFGYAGIIACVLRNTGENMKWYFAAGYVAALCLFAINLTCCDQQRPSHEQAVTSGPVVMASIYPMANLASQILGDLTHVDTLLPPGVTPHGFELHADRLQLLHQADILITIGGPVDKWVEDAAAKSGNDIQIARFSAEVGIDIADEADHHHDHHSEQPGERDEHTSGFEDHTGREVAANPHLWLDPILTIEFVEKLGRILAGQYPGHRSQIEKNTAELIQSLHEIDRAYRQQLGDIEEKKLITFHNAFDLLAARYGLHVVQHLIPIDLVPGGEVKSRQLVQAIDAIRQFKLKVVYAEPQFPDTAIKALQRETGVEVLRLDPLGHPEVDGYHTYQAMMLSNLEVLVGGQSRVD